MKKIILLLGILIVLSGVVFADLDDESLMAWYSFDTNVSDDHGTKDGVPIGVTHLTSGCVLSGCYSFDGNDYIDLTDNYNGVYDSFAISLWVKYSSSNQMILWSGINNEGPEIMQINGYLRFIYTTGSGNNDLENTGTPNNGMWRHLVAIYNGTHKAIWIDGVLNASTATSGFGLTPATDTEIGKRPGDTIYYIGQMDEVGFWNRSLTPTEISQLYNNGNGFSYPFIVDADGDGVLDEEDLCPNTTTEEPKEPNIYGCSCKQILDLKPGKNNGELKHGCSKGTINVFTKLIGWARHLFE